jgi:hypothetical protein
MKVPKLQISSSYASSGRPYPLTASSSTRLVTVEIVAWEKSMETEGLAASRNRPQLIHHSSASSITNTKL